ncbi:3-keto-5-aminohexanoate cleavage protein [Psychromarinibacter sp. C21-152]|uniref:3-keto-5-aminohexanoate cleavage protein n=1 Tax=Psychromarinibacter sediminicola TaxID=3033385 RepID=A0AAE3NUR8_9RHOB|nr:3-keto-5-aminohexanoate cleavage protein [Psychromarinibacter sediminicola]MDF0603943.1 3-keto-5-aminohexanoate cleavage protein [Psychromarinibacter sediminicola]
MKKHMSELCIMLAPNGARRTKADHPAIPVSADELAETAVACRAAGAGGIHLHVRDNQLVHSLDADTYRSAIGAIQSACPDIAIQTTTEAAGLFDVDQQIAAVRALRPACLSFSLAELLRDGEDKAEAFLAWAAETGIGIQFILYDAEQIATMRRMLDAGTLHVPDRPRLIVVAGRYSATQDSSAAEFDALHNALVATDLHREAIWMTCAFGRGEMACLDRTIELGGHARVGFENAFADADGKLARDNAERVRLVAALAAKHGRPLADAAGSATVLGRLSDAAIV